MNDRTDVDRILDSVQPLPRARAWPALVALVGPPGTGKSTLARDLAERTPLVVLCADDIRTLLAPQPDYSFEESQRVVRAMRLAAGALLQQGIGVVLDAANLTEWERQPLYGLAERHRARLVIVQVTAPMNVVLDRLQAKVLQPAAMRAAESAVESPTDVYHRLAGRQEPITREHYTVDTSRDIQQFVEGLVLDLDEG